ncbi:hypothetical protein [Bacillus sp. J37]|uniref:hypothetical protein n=1 Tax=Bacillus sp. J37 TaxID=935837 RepID=UPI00047DF1EA|nr:hypothetical protein [Bacillus sp. J37]
MTILTLSSFSILFATIVVLLIQLHKREEANKQERQDLMDRLMSKDFAEYKEQTGEMLKFEPITVSEEDEYYREIEESKV